MKIINPGHVYSLEAVGEGPSQTVTFIKRIGSKYPFNHGEELPGTNCQEVIRVLVDRSRFLYTQQPCIETQMIIGALENALAWFETRAARCHNRHLDLPNVDRLISGPFCSTCGHFECSGHSKECV